MASSWCTGPRASTPPSRVPSRAAARRTAVVQSSNMSVGVNLLLELTEQVAGVLGDDYDVEIIELFHRDKADAPSGTSLALGRAAAAGRGVDLDAVAIYKRDGEIGPRPRGAIGFAVLRGGDLPGEHTVVFAGTGERVEIAHKASSRTIYTQGAVAAARWAAGKPAGLYSMRDVLARRERLAPVENRHRRLRRPPWPPAGTRGRRHRGLRLGRRHGAARQCRHRL